MIWLALLTITSLIVLLAWMTRGCSTVIRMFIIMLAGFWLLQFVGRPLAVYLDKPTSPSRHPLADYRLAWDGYEGRLLEVLFLVILGLAASVSTVWLVRRTKVALTETSAWQPYWSAALIAAVALGWVGRLMGPIWSPIELLEVLATPSVALLVVFTDWKSSGRGIVLFVLAAIGEMYWALSSQSKSSIMALLLALLIWSTRSLSGRQRHVVYLALPLSVVAVFAAIQPLKGAYANDVGQYSTHFAGPFDDFAITVLTRTDLIVAVTDAMSTPTPPSFAPETYVERIGQGLTPDGGFSNENIGSGLVWTRDMRAATNPDQFLGVSLAEGPIAEGFVLGGIGGVLALSVVMMTATFVLCAGIGSRSLWVRCLCAMPVFGSSLYERGPLGLSEAIGKGLQYAVVVVMLLAIAKALDPHDRVGHPRSEAFRNVITSVDARSRE